MLSNFASQQTLLRLLDGLTALTGAEQYRQAAEDATRHALANLRTPNGLLYWGGHSAWDLKQDRPIGLKGARIHELKSHSPYFRLMWRIDPGATRMLIESIWAGHLLDWSLLDYNRHASTTRPRQPRWEAPFRENVEVPFPAVGSNKSFCNVSSTLIHAGAMLAILDDHDAALTWTRRLVYRWQQACDPITGLSGGLLSYGKDDRAQAALGYVHPNINNAKIVASYHQTSRYHRLPLVQMIVGEALASAEGKRLDVGRQFIDWASRDLQVYAKHCYDPDKGVFVARMTDGTLIRGEQAREGYFNRDSFEPAKPSGYLLQSYVMAYRLTRDQAHWTMASRLCRDLGLGELGQPDDTHRALRFDTDSQDWQIIYALLELHDVTDDVTDDDSALRLACRVADNILASQADSGLFPRTDREYARTGDEIPLALLHLAAALEGRRDLIPQATPDRQFFHAIYYGELEPHQQKRADERTQDNRVFYDPR